MRTFLLVFLLITGSMSAQTDNIQTATLGSGCFWCTEAIFERVKGVISVEPGYSGGHVKNPAYREVCNGTTGHAEVIHLKFDNTVITYAEILEIFWQTHNPTQLNRQGADVGTQYRSVIFYHSPEQKQKAEELKDKLGKAQIWDKPIVTQIDSFTNFYKAEDYHRDYYQNNPTQGYCQFVITPKIERFENIFGEYLKAR